MKKISKFVVIVFVAIFASNAFAGGGGGGPAPVDVVKLANEVHLMHGLLAKMAPQLDALQKENAQLKAQVAGLQAQASASKPVVDFVKKLMAVLQIAADTGPSGKDRLTFGGPISFDSTNVIFKISEATDPPYANDLASFYLSFVNNSLGQQQATAALQKQATDNGPAMTFVQKLMGVIEIVPNSDANELDWLFFKGPVTANMIYAVNIVAEDLEVWNDLSIVIDAVTGEIHFHDFYTSLQNSLLNKNSQ